MSETVYINQKFFCTDFGKMLREMRLLEAELQDFRIELAFRGGGFDNDYWCDFEGIYVYGHREKTEAEYAAEAAEAERNRLAELERQKAMLPRIAARLAEEELALHAELTKAKERLQALNEGEQP
jgi:hypothetical protein